MSALKILLVDDHALFRSGLCFLLEGLDQAIEITEAESCEQALEVCDDTTELILLDYHLPDCDGNFDALKKIKTVTPSSTVVVLSSEDDPSIIRGAVESGAAGFIPKSSTPNVMITALKSILAGGIYLPSMAFSSADKKDASPKTPFEKDEEIPLDHSLVSQLSSTLR